MALDRERRARLEEARLRALIARAGGEPDGADVEVLDPAAVAVTADGRGWATVSGDDGRGLGAVLFWASRRDVGPLTLFVTDGAGIVARRARGLAPRPEVFAVNDAEIRPAEPAELPTWPPPDDEMRALADVLAGAGLDVYAEQGTFVGEIDGLEIARVVSGDEGPRLEIGIGRYDREAAVLLHGDKPRLDEIARVAGIVRAHRRAGADHHPLGTLARERWLRAAVVRDPALVGLTGLEPVEPVVARRGLRDRVPAAAVGTAPDGSRVLVLCSVGVDPDLVAVAADHVVRDRPDRVLVVLPPRDLIPPVERVLGRLAVPAEARGVVPPWEAPPAT